MSELAYSLHLGSDKNKQKVSRKQAKETASGTTSKSNNAIQNARQLSRVDKHNYRKYDNDQDDIQIIRGTTSLYEDVKELYLKEFEAAKNKYNELIFSANPPVNQCSLWVRRDHATNKPSGSYPSFAPKCSTLFFQFLPK